jgi:hypothetical protein
VRGAPASALTVAFAIAVALEGCALNSGAAPRPAPPAATSRARSASAPPRAPTSEAAAPTTNEVPTPAPGQTVAGGWPSPARAVEEFATAYVNWDYRTVSLRLRSLSQVSVGQARTMLSTAAAEVSRDYELRRGQIANRGAVEAIGPVRGHSDEYAVVTRERTTAANTNAYQGLAPAWHVALATVTRVRGLWVLRAWQPES